MLTHSHPLSGKEVQGFLLGTNAEIRTGDLFNSKSGEWEKAPNPGCRLERGHEVIWVRPSEPSNEATCLFIHLVGNGFFLAKTNHWQVIPTPAWNGDGRMDWNVKPQSAAQELVDFGFFGPMIGYDEVYKLTRAGKEFFASLRSVLSAS